MKHDSRKRNYYMIVPISLKKDQLPSSLSSPYLSLVGTARRSSDCLILPGVEGIVFVTFRPIMECQYAATLLTKFARFLSNEFPMYFSFTNAKSDSV